LVKTSILLSLSGYDQIISDLNFVCIDQNDESLNRWKASLGLNTGEPIGDPNDPRTCIIQSLAIETPGRPDITLDLTGANALETLKDKPFTIKEGSKFFTKVVFQVHRDVLSGLKYVHVVKRKGITVTEDEEMLVRLPQSRLLHESWCIC
jgi:Rho GDP-dissociation inhibitor